MTTAGLPNQLGTEQIPPELALWLASQGAVWARMGADGIAEFSRRPIELALADAARDLLEPPAQRAFRRTRTPAQLAQPAQQ